MIALLGSSDLGKLCVHLDRNGAESNRDGDVLFRPRNAVEKFDVKAAKERLLGGWGRRVGDSQWIRTWGLTLSGQIRGHVDLHGGMLPTEQHRAMLGIGIERSARGRGYGRQLLDTVIAWAREHQLAWIDLGVFSANAPARWLYAKAGFVEIGITRDRFRVDGISVDDVAMTLAL
ncbi:MAG: GNAT family N-acetyltransferase [Kofleriaceae bacterium]